MNRKQKKMLYRIIVTAVLVIAYSVLCSILDIRSYVQLVLYMLPYLIIGYDIIRKAGLGIIHRNVFDENFLMAVATMGAIALGDYREGVAVMLFYQTGELFQSCAVGKSRRNIAELMDIRPDYANICIDGVFTQTDPDSVEPGTVIAVLPGERVPIDGVIVEGTSALDTGALTGESVPVDVGEGSNVISGCVNMTGLIKLQTTRKYGESTVSRILELVENSGMRKSRSEDFITKFARYYTPAVCIAALVIALFPPLTGIMAGTSPMWGQWIVRSLTFLVISCPCALVISIPLSFFGGIGGASARGILIKGSNYLEQLSKTKYVVFDKTGTLTEGVFKVTEIKSADDGISEEQLLHLAAHAESCSKHPISRSLREAYGRETDERRVSDVEEISGCGINAKVEGVMVAVGNDKLMKQMKLNYIKPEAAGTVVHVAVAGEYAGYLIISDVVKKNASKAIRELKSSGIKKTVMLTGDSGVVADRISKELRIDEVRSELLPDDKVAEVEALLEAKQKGEQLVFVGDGINDAPVLARADIGIAMGAMGSDAAIEAADIVLMDDDPAKIATAIKIAGKTLRIVKQNIVFALSVKGMCLLLGAMGVANMWMAIFADVGVMVIAVVNATRTLNTRQLT